MSVVQMWKDIAGALVECEKHNIVHRNIKPGTILVSDSGIFQLGSFSCAGEGVTPGIGCRIGTEQYMAPEVYLGKRNDKRSDFYSLGMAVYSLLNGGHRPFVHWSEKMTYDNNQRADARRVAGEKIPAISHVPRKVNNVLLKCLSCDPEKRYQNAAELYSAVEKVYNSEQEELQKRWIDISRLAAENPELFGRMNHLKASFRSFFGR